MKKKLISIIGLGYIGLPTAALLASEGFVVNGCDINQDVIDTINQGEIHIVEPELHQLVRSALATGRLKVSTSPQAGDIYIICVPTPFHKSSNIPQPNIDYVLAATKSIAPYIKPGDIVILESTSPVGTTKQIQELLSDFAKTDQLHIAYCPERVLPGNIIKELVENDRIIGGVTAAATKAAASFYRSFVKGEVHEVDDKTAEMCKLTENSFRDLNIAFANELSLVCDKAGINVWNLIELANHHPRVNILQPGVGVGGHCIAVDPWFIISRDIENTKLIRTSREINNYKTDWVINKIKIAADKKILKNSKKPTIACLGLAFKPNIDDLRESPALHIAEALKLEGYNIIAVEPNINSHKNFPIVDLEKALVDAEIIVILVKHRQFIDLRIQQQLTLQSALDFCGALQHS